MALIVALDTAVHNPVCAVVGFLSRKPRSTRTHLLIHLAWRCGLPHPLASTTLPILLAMVPVSRSIRGVHRLPVAEIGRDDMSWRSRRRRPRVLEHRAVMTVAFVLFAFDRGDDPVGDTCGRRAVTPARTPKSRLEFVSSWVHAVLVERCHPVDKEVR